MARLPRLALAGQTHHVLQRGHNRQPLFEDDQDREAFLSLLHRAAKAQQVAIHGYALLNTEIHVLATPASVDALSRAMQVIARAHGSRMNLRYGRQGTLWAGRFRASVIQPEPWTLRCLRYIESAAVRSGAVGRAEDYAWCSARHHLGLSRDPRLTEHAAYWSLGNTPFDRESAWRKMLETALTRAEMLAIESAAEKSWVLGDEGFRATLMHQTDRPLAPRRRGRPKLAARGGKLSPKDGNM